MKIYITDKKEEIQEQKNCKALFYQTVITKFKTLAHDTIQWLKFVVQYLNMNMKEKLIEINDLQLGSLIKWDQVQKRGCLGLDPVY